ncbi:ROK family transcriptional regulator [Nonomuraea sp. NBC_01738]|uniref:ROK family transcriptional regulator n=1 Tax=Nonomuraea sp. NBC_01738 TaxID=2976003 RepID=UPI002E12C968|nr:ROK family transcriptional regulator [Nonomuraea sp. NBC_01738]
MRSELGNPRLLRVMNERRLLDHLDRHGPASRADLAKITGLSKPTVSAALAGLEEDGLVHLVGEVLGRPGPVTALYDMNAASAHVAGIDIGRDWIRVAVADLRGEFAGRTDGRNTARTSAGLAELVGDLARAAAAKAGVAWPSITCAVVGSPGVYDPVAARLDFAPNLPGPDLAARLRAALEVDLVIENDINLAAVGEHTYGEGRGKANFALVSIGTGVGMGIVVNGELYVGARGAAGEVSYLPAPADDLPPQYGEATPAGGADGGAEAASTGDLPLQRGETAPADGSLGSGEPAGEIDALAHGATEAVAAAPGVVRAARAAGLRLETAKEVFAAAAGGDRAALSVVEAEGRRIGGLLVAVTAVLDPEVIVLSGGVGRNLDLLGRAIQDRVAELGPLRPAIVASTLGDSGVLLGAVAHARTRAWDHIFTARKA